MPVLPTRLTLLLLLIASVGCATQAGDGVRSTAEDDAAIDALYDRFSRAYDELDSQAVVALYTEDALYLSGDRPIRQGSAAVAEAFSFLDRIRQEGGTTSITFRSVDRSIEGNLAHDVGYYKTVFTPPGGEPRASAGKFVVVLKKQADGSWRFHVDGYNAAPLEAFDQSAAP